MRKKRRILAVGCLTILLLAAAGLWGLYRAAQQEPEFYRKALAAEPAAQRKASDQMLQRATGLASRVRRMGQWEAVFTADQINGWLAVDLVENHPGALPPTLHNPRVTIEPDGITAACRFQQGRLSSILTLKLEPYLPEPNVLALRIRKARAGLVPVPLDNVLKAISEVGARMDLDMRWRQADGDPVAIIRIPPPRGEGQKRVRIEALRLAPGEIYLSGRTEKQGK